MADPGFAGLVSRKYQIEQENADSQQRLAQANAGLINTQAQLAPDEAAARNYATRGSGFASFQQGNLFGTNAALAPGLAESEEGERAAQGNLFGAQAQETRNFDNYTDPNIDAGFNRRWGLGGTPAPGAPPTAPNTTYTPGLGTDSHWQGRSVLGPHPQGRSVLGPQANNSSNIIGGNPLFASTGMDRVPGQGDGTVDTQPAMLAPGEAVLNRGAAEHLGRDTISLLNAIGAHKMGLTAAAPDVSHPATGSNGGVENQTGAPSGGTTPHYAWGTADTSKPPAPGPGQTTSNGSWGTPTPNADIRNSVGRPGVPRVVSKPQAMNDVPGYAKGVAKVPGKAGGKEKKGTSRGGGGSMSDAAAQHTPDGSGLSPGILQALMQMGGGGGMGGAPGGAAPMGGGVGGAPGGAAPMGGGMPPPGMMPPPSSLPLPQVARR